MKIYQISQAELDDLQTQLQLIKSKIAPESGAAGELTTNNDIWRHVNYQMQCWISRISK